MSRKDLLEKYSTGPSARSLNNYKKSVLKYQEELEPVYKTQKGPIQDWTGYRSSSSEPKQRLDSESEEETSKPPVLTKPKVPKPKQPELKWLGAKLGSFEEPVPKELLEPNAPVVYRNKSGQVIQSTDPELLIKQENQQRLSTWTYGAVQKSQVEEEALKRIEEKQKPFSRYEIEEDTDQVFRKRERFGDPIQAITTKKKPMNASKYSWENRFNIAPGCKWDGVDRSNGYEARWLAKQGRKAWENHYVYKEFASEL